MANYNTFNVIDCRTRKNILSTSSARKAYRMLEVGVRVEVWNDNTLAKTVYNKNRKELNPYIQIEKQYIAQKQKQAEERNKRRRMRVLAREA